MEQNYLQMKKNKDKKNKDQGKTGDP